MGMDMAEHAIEMLCSYMPETIADKCIDFVQEYGDEIVDLIIKAEMNPDQVCAAITLCTSPYTTWDARPVGGHRPLGVQPSGANPASMPELVEPLNTARTTSGTTKNKSFFEEEENNNHLFFTKIG